MTGTMVVMKVMKPFDDHQILTAQDDEGDDDHDEVVVLANLSVTSMETVCTEAKAVVLYKNM